MWRLGFRVGGNVSERVLRGSCFGYGVEAEPTGGGMGVPSPPCFDLICLIRTPIQTEIQTCAPCAIGSGRCIAGDFLLWMIRGRTEVGREARGPAAVTYQMITCLHVMLTMCIPTHGQHPGSVSLSKHLFNRAGTRTVIRNCRLQAT